MKLQVKYQEKAYILEYTRKTVKEMEKRGFDVTKVDSKPMTYLPMLFEGAFLAHHRFVKSDIIETIFEELNNKEALLGKLVEMYNEPILSLLDEKETQEGNASWTETY